MSRGLSFAKLIDALEKHHGRPPTLPVTTALGLVLWENVAYLASDKRRAQAFEELRDMAVEGLLGAEIGPGIQVDDTCIRSKIDDLGVVGIVLASIDIHLVAESPQRFGDLKNVDVHTARVLFS